MSFINKAIVSSTDPKLPAANNVTKTVAHSVPSDKVVVNATEAGTVTEGKNTYAVIVLTIVAKEGTTAVAQSDGSVQITATDGTGTQYVSCTLSSADPENWTVNADVKGGNGYKFVRGNGGAGRA